MENIKDYMPESPDFNQERLDKLKELFPDLFTSENKLNTEELKKLVEPDSISETERYEFRWFGKSNAKRNAFTPSNATLIYDEERSVNPAESENLIIEGENLEVLKLLSGSYREKIKCIYIDPPYNTGKDFVYSDNFTQDKKAYWEDAGIVENGLKIDTNTETDGRYHSNWLNMMYSRLLVARQLLREDGVIFMSIDDNEIHHLRKLCDEIFGEENFVGNIILQTATDNNPSQINTEHEYILCYAKSKIAQPFWEAKSHASDLIISKYEELKTIFQNDLSALQVELRKWIKQNKESLPRVTHYDNVDERGVYHDADIANTKFGGYNYEILHPKTQLPCKIPEKGFRFPEETMRTMILQNEIVFGNDETTLIKPKKRIENVKDVLRTVIYEDGRGSTKVVNDLLGRGVFDNPKSQTVLQRLFDFVTIENDIVLDFFGGSGTTGQAITELNIEDGGNRKYILVQLPEKTDEKSEAYKGGYKKISDITIERNKRVIEKLIATKEAEQPDLFTEENKEENLKGLGFKVFKLAKSNFPRVDFAPDPAKTDAENVELLKKYIAEKEAQLVNAFNREELLTEILLKKGYNLNYTAEVQSHFTKNEVLLAQDGEKQTLICLDVSIEDETVEYFKTHKDQNFICLERALDTTKKYNLKHYLGELVDVF